MFSGSGRTRIEREGWTGRRRNYKCRECGEKFQHDGGQLPKGTRVCRKCKEDPEVRQQVEKAWDEYYRDVLGWTDEMIQGSKRTRAVTV